VGDVGSIEINGILYQSMEMPCDNRINAVTFYRGEIIIVTYEIEI
jgi:hypothetical protein